MADGFWDDAEVISGYSRAQAIEDGVLVDIRQKPTAERPELDDLDKIAREAGIKYPAAMTDTAFFEWIVPSEADAKQGQSVAGRLWDLWTIYKLEARKAAEDRLTMKMKVWKGGRSLWATFYVVVGPGDTPDPVLTFMLPGED